jgi:hypothetical protein
MTRGLSTKKSSRPRGDASTETRCRSGGREVGRRRTGVDDDPVVGCEVAAATAELNTGVSSA